METLQFISQETSKFTHLQSIQSACEAGVKWIQLRIKDKSPEEVLKQVEQAKLICDRYDAKLIINDYPEVAAKVNAFGVHVGKEDMPIPSVRKIVGKDCIIGGTANTLEDILHHVKSGADYVGVGPFRFTTTKKKLSPVLGTDGYKIIMDELKKRGITIPVFAIGGIDIADVKSIIKTGVHGVAVSSLIAISDDKKKTVDMINSLIYESSIQPAC